MFEIKKLSSKGTVFFHNAAGIVEKYSVQKPKRNLKKFNSKSIEILNEIHTINSASGVERRVYVQNELMTTSIVLQSNVKHRVEKKISLN